jgi:alkylation response protein AidB-like acyl-CoA dehydrogenase
MSFYQDPPRLANQYDDDPLLREHLVRTLPADVLRAIEPELRELGELVAGPLGEMQRADRESLPTLTPWDAWGRRIDHITVVPQWKEARRLTAKHGFVAVAYERKTGEHARVHQMAMNYIVQPSLDMYSCPLAMTDGAARTLLDLGNQALIARALPRLTARDPESAWTSGQWMTERTGGSDVGLSETVARQGSDGKWRLWGTKWFTSATTSEMALTLGRPEGNGAGGRGLALFYVETHGADGRGALAEGISVNRLKDKLGTRKVPTAELTLEGAVAVPVVGLTEGIKNITSMLTITRTWNAQGAISGMRRGVALARDYARRRVQFGAPLSEKPLHVETLAGLQAEQEGAFLLTFRVIGLLGRVEAGVATEAERALFRLITPLAKLTTGKQAVAVASEAIECHGGAGYVEDTGLPTLLRDAQVLPIWEGTTNVLSLDVLRALVKGGGGTLEAYQQEINARLAAASDPSLAVPVAAVKSALAHAEQWMRGTAGDPVKIEAGARGFAMTLGRSIELALLCDHAQWCLANGKGPRAAAAARRLAVHGVDSIRDGGHDDAALLARGDGV